MNESELYELLGQLKAARQVTDKVNDILLYDHNYSNYSYKFYEILELLDELDNDLRMDCL